MADPQFDPWSAVMADEPTALEMAKARAAALRGQNYAGMVMGLAHDPQAAKMGGELMQQAQTGQAQLGELPGQRMQRLLQQQHLQQAGPQEALGGLPPSIFEALTKRAQVPKYASDMFGRYNVHTGEGTTTPGGGVDSLLSPEAIDQHARKYLQDQTLPSMGKANPVVHGAIIRRAAELGGSQNLAANRASTKADTGSLGKLQTSADSIDAFENTALKNLDQLDLAAKNAIDTGFPILNKPIRSLDAKILGDPRMSVFNAARQTAVQEVGKVLGGAVSGGAISDSQRHEVDAMLSGDMTLPQIRAVIQQLKTDMENRKSSTHAQLAEIRGRLGGKAPDSGAPAAAAPAPAAKPDVRARIAQLKASGATPDALRQQLKSEYTPDELKAAVGGGR